MDAFRLGLREGIGQRERGALTAEEWTRACLERIARLDPRVEAFTWLDPAAALDRARRADAAPAGPLRGAPLGVKDVFDTRGVLTRMGSPAYGDYVPERSATVVQRLEDAGALVLGKTVTAELAYILPGKTRNPWNAAHTPGGSSSGSAAAVAAGFVPAALGTQTNGSVIRPAAFCGCVGFKPSYGRLSRAGVLTFSPTLDHVGCFTRTVADAALVVALCAGPDAEDPATVDAPPPAPEIAPRRAAPSLIAVRSPVWDRAEPAAQAHFAEVLERLRAAGATVEERELPEAFNRGHTLLRTIMTAEGARAFAALVRDWPHLLSQTMHILMSEGQAVSDALLRDAHDERLRLAQALEAFIGEADAIVTLPAAGEAPATVLNTGDPSFCTLWTLCGVPAITVPSGRGPRGLPLGTQLVGRALADAELLATAQWCETVFRAVDPLRFPDEP
ncbi:MAG TPA: amidase [Burkholderiales bacterium]